ncbi:bifunctional DNA primase/polymerase [Saccharothrix texasensis]|uniref:Bifunctional DNA primase/polymerase-like protein n=1 Tax=Saccharothrix texasensis TaxID=103734 RepID=A0A3N1H9B2_9PSEU|nr:bifunctional DNA primase/polymerase [Saccharothrix texasensis]ROP39110.1 bifunctional DNA primase/polymerase-like protein [Saccharothrix texasensis]
MSFQDTLLRHALAAAAMGFHVFPLRPGTKIPALHGVKSCPRNGVCSTGHVGWEQRATTDRAVIERCWSAGPFNIGIATGPSGLLVVDLDTPKSPAAQDKDGCSRQGIEWGRDVLAELCVRTGQPVEQVFDTRAVATPRGGEHLYFHAPSGVELRNTQDALGPLVDTRATGGYVVGPGSRTPDGTYTATDDREPSDALGWLVQALSPKPRTAVSAPVVLPTRRLDAYVDAAVRAEYDRVAAAQRGKHSKTLFIAAVALGRHVGEGNLSSTTAEHHLLTAAAHMIGPGCDCTEAKVRRTISDGLRAGASTQRPSRPGNPTAPATRGAA